jgi:hypothetical protein
MKVVVWMVVVCSVSCALLAARVGAPQALWFGMLGPLASAAISWILIERAVRLRPAAVSRLMMTSFFAKMLFFAAYVVAGLTILHVQPAPFAAAFTGYFVGLHLAEAMLLRRLFATGEAAARR